MSKSNKPLQTVLMVVLILVLAIGGYFLANALGADKLFSVGLPSASPSPSPSPSITPAPYIHVKVMGAVKNPGEYILRNGSIFQQAVEAAGGFTEDADIKAANLGVELKEGAVIMVLEKQSKP